MSSTDDSIFEFLNMTPAQQVFEADQAEAKIKDLAPEASPVLHKASELAVMVHDLAETNPQIAHGVMDSIESLFMVFRMMHPIGGQDG